jgi:Zn-dependent peptidase ImmA (M78 family)
MPEAELRRLVEAFSMMALDPATEEHVKKVARKLQVSSEALTIRLANLGLLS